MVGGCGFFKAAALALMMLLCNDGRGSGAVSELVGAFHCLPLVVGAIGGYAGSGSGIGVSSGVVLMGSCTDSRPMSYKSCAAGGHVG